MYYWDEKPFGYEEDQYLRYNPIEEEEEEITDELVMAFIRDMESDDTSLQFDWIIRSDYTEIFDHELVTTDMLQRWAERGIRYKDFLVREFWAGKATWAWRPTREIYDEGLRDECSIVRAAWANNPSVKPTREQLIAMFTDPDDHVREAWAGAHHFIDHEMVDILQQDPNPSVREKVPSKTLMNSQSFKPEQIRRGLDDSHPYVRKAWERYARRNLVLVREYVYDPAKSPLKLDAAQLDRALEAQRETVNSKSMQA